MSMAAIRQRRKPKEQECENVRSSLLGPVHTLCFSRAELKYLLIYTQQKYGRSITSDRETKVEFSSTGSAPK